MLEVEKDVQSTDSRVYELGYLLTPAIKEEDVPAAYGNLKELLTSLGGEVIADEMPKMIPLSYTMEKVVTNVRHKFNTAYFGWVKFYMKAPKILELKSKLDLNPDFVRFLITKTVKENTIAAKRFIRSDMVHRKPFYPKREKEEGVAIEINKEEIDKEIDAMVAI